MPDSYVRFHGDKEGLGTDPALKEFIEAFTTRTAQPGFWGFCFL